MTDILMHKITHFIGAIGGLDVWTLNCTHKKPTNQKFKVVKPTNKKLYYKTLGTSVINGPMSPALSV